MAKFSIKEIFSGDILIKEWLKRQYKIILLVCVLIFIYIHSGLKTEQHMLEINELRKELHDSQITLLSLNTELMDKTRIASILQLLEEQGSELQPNQTPTIRIQ